MKSLFYFFFIIISSFCFSQNTIVRYLEYRKIEDQTNVSFLIFNETNSYNIQSFIKLYDNYQDLLADKNFVDNHKYNRNIMKKDLYSNQYFGVNEIMRKGIVIYKDDLPKIEWKFLNEEMTILGYKCKSATTEFRGRKYKVWYTLEIPVPIGPWKLGGLPGLILKADADNGMFTFEATSINMNSSLTVPKRYVSLYEENKDKIFEYKKVMEYESKVLEEFRQEQIANLPKDVTLTDIPPIRINLIETIFN